VEDFCSTFKVEQNINEEKRGAHNKQYIIVSPDCFKELCMHVGTSRSKEIKKYINTNNTYAGYLWSTNIQLDNYVNYEIIDLK
jgi:hypothetical protein